MKPIKTLLVCLDLTEMDELLIQYAAYLAHLLDSIQEVHFMHNIRFDHAEDAKAILEQLDSSLQEIVIESIEDKVAQYFSPESADISTTIFVEEEHSTPHSIARLAKEQKVQLVLAGKKISYKGSGLVLEKLLRINDFSSSLLLVPETAYHQIQNILVPTDFSKNSKLAIEMGGLLKEEAQANMSLQHVFSIPAFYFPSLAAKDIEPTMRAQSERRWRKFAKELPQIGADQMECILTFNHDKNVAQTIYDHAVRNNKDLIIVSALGRGGFAAFLVGRVALQLVQADLHIPLLIVKKGE